MLSVIKTVFQISAAVALLLMVCFSRLLTGPAVAADRFGVVTASSLNLRLKPEQASPSVFLLTRGDRVAILQAEPGWLKIEYKGIQGFVFEKFIQPVEGKQGLPSAGLPSGPLSLKAKTLKAQLKQKQSEATEITRREIELVDNLNKIDSTLNQLEKNAAALEKKLAVLAAALKENEAVAATLETEVAQLETYASQRLVALYKLSCLGSLPLLASADSVYDLLTKKKSLQTLLAHDELIWKTLETKKISIAGVREALVAQRQTHEAQAAELEAQLPLLTRRRTEREQLLTQIKEEKSLAMAAIAELKAAARAMEDRIKAAEANRAPEPAAGRPFESLKGLLKMPVRGKIIHFFGPYTTSPLNVTGFSSGIDISAEMGEPIRAVNQGKTLYAGWFKGYGNIVILDHGSSYYTVYAHAREIYKQKGETVAAGEVIATVGDTGSFQGPTLHFEIRHHGKPVDPLKWIEERSPHRNDTTANR